MKRTFHNLIESIFFPTQARERRFLAPHIEKVERTCFVGAYAPDRTEPSQRGFLEPRLTTKQVIKTAVLLVVCAVLGTFFACASRVTQCEKAPGSVTVEFDNATSKAPP